MPSLRTEGLHKKYGLWKMSLQSFPPVFGKSLIFQLFLRVISSLNVKVRTISMIMVVCLALLAIMNGVDGPTQLPP